LLVTTYELYCPDGNWSLLLVNPDETNPQSPGDDYGQMSEALHQNAIWQKRQPHTGQTD
jgi:hypothetical protein